MGKKKINDKNCRFIISFGKQQFVFFQSHHLKPFSMQTLKQNTAFENDMIYTSELILNRFHRPSDLSYLCGVEFIISLFALNVHQISLKVIYL